MKKAHPLVLRPAAREKAVVNLKLLGMVVGLVLMGSLITWLSPPDQIRGQSCTPSLPNGSVVGALTLTPTIENIGVRLAYTGDGNANANAYVEWKLAADSIWRRGIDLTRISGNRWAGSVFSLTTGSTYSIRVTIEDPDCGGTVTDTVTTRSTPSPTPTRVIWVAPNGSPTAPAPGSQGSPLSLQNAKTQAQAGDELRLLPGTYDRTNSAPSGGALGLFEAGTAGDVANYIHLVGYCPSGPCTSDRGVIFDGSAPAMRSTTDWQSVGGGVYSHAYNAAPSSDLRVVFVEHSGEVYRLYRHTSLTNLQNGADGIAQGFFYNPGTDTLYVRLEGGVSPNSPTKVYIPSIENGVVVDGRNYWHIEGITFQFFGMEPSSGYGAALRISNTTAAWIRSNKVQHIGGRGIWTRRSGNNHVIENNDIYDSRLYDWPWLATKGHTEEIGGIDNRESTGLVIRNNHINGMFDGISPGGDVITAGNDSDVYNNLLERIRDDALESDTVEGTNLRMYRNTIRNVFSGVAITPNYIGPQYILFNTFVDFQRVAQKLGVSSTGQTYWYHNSMYSDRTSFVNWDGTTVNSISSLRASNNFSNMHYRNNIFYGYQAPIMINSGYGVSGNDFDANWYYLKNSSAIFQWNATNYNSIAAIQSGLGWETHGQTGNPIFVDEAAGDLTLQAGSGAIDAAVRLVGINDEYQGTAPDMGAVEYASGPPTCIENWSCGSWSVCSAGQQTRICTDLNNCGTVQSRPPLTQSCTMPDSIAPAAVTDVRSTD